MVGLMLQTAILLYSIMCGSINALLSLLTVYQTQQPAEGESVCLLLNLISAARQLCATLILLFVCIPEVMILKESIRREMSVQIRNFISYTTVCRSDSVRTFVKNDEVFV